MIYAKKAMMNDDLTDFYSDLMGLQNDFLEY